MLTAGGKLVPAVYEVLGRQRDDAVGRQRGSAPARLGPATDAAPLLGALRIGKADPEGTPDGDGECPTTFLCNVDMASVDLLEICWCRLLCHEHLNSARLTQVSICTT